MRDEYHRGELEVQRQAGVREIASRVAGSIHATVPPIAKTFLEQRRFVVVATTDAEGRPWASVLTGRSGFVRVLDQSTIQIDADPVPGDPLTDTLHTSPFLALIAPDLATRRRLRLNGRLELAEDGTILIHTHQVYSNCPKYIQRRDGEQQLVEHQRQPPRRSASLTDEQRKQIRWADTFFIATVNPGEGADVSHRGGMPGFVRVEGDRLGWPDYRGNSMFNTLGNIAAYPRAGVVVPDFEMGSTLQLTGRAAIDWDHARAAAVPGAERLVDFVVEEVVEIRGALPLGLRLLDYSPFNPELPEDSARDNVER